MADRGDLVYLGPGSFTKDIASSCHRLSGLLNLHQQRCGQSWGFAHLAEAFNGLHSSKTDKFLQDNNLGTHLEQEMENLRRGDLNRARKCPGSLNSKVLPKDACEDHDVPELARPKHLTYRGHGQPEIHSQANLQERMSSHKKGFDGLTYRGMARGVYLLSDVLASPQLELDNGQYNRLNGFGRSHSSELSMHTNLCKSVLPDGIDKFPSLGLENTAVQYEENVWEYDFSSEPLPDLMLGRAHVSSNTRLGLCSPTTSASRGYSKIVLRRLPLKPIETHVVTIRNTGKLPTVKRSKQQKVEKKKGEVRRAHILKQLVCGGFAGVISRTAVAPLDLIKTHLITSHGLRGSPKSAMAICKEILSHGGWPGLFRGNVVNCIRVAPSKAIELSVFESVRRALNKEGHPLKNWAATVAGGAAGMAGTIVTYPLELIRTRLSVQPELYSGLLQAISKIAQEEGFTAFYAGLSPSLVGVFPYAATNYFVYDGLRTTYCHSTGCHNVPTIPTLVFGAVAAAASSSVTYPLEVARRQMQLSLPRTILRKSTISVILDIYQQEGFLALYRGLGTTWLKLIPAAGISFVCYEAARLAFHIDEASMKKPEETYEEAEEKPTT